ncbi:MAG TPA: 2-amino-4-hydroxy-6-hydroxymethyldihydropteridine diphosphokinase [Gammaproteobacteria bacterium]|nr:2-amino-4-hydroxy-6-hydroxymethyldihydropteridine diphosphokinase [Gammaproteobacteria bacterium]
MTKRRSPAGADGGAGVGGRRTAAKKRNRLITRAYIGLGSNLDDPRAHVERALGELAALPCVSLLAASPLYRSRPMGPQDQPDFVNAVACLETTRSPARLLAELQRLEAVHGRTRNDVRWGPRPLDLDLLIFGLARINTADLTVPHPGLAARNFVLYPLADIAPHDLRVPGFGRLGSLLGRVNDGDLEKLGAGE